MKRKTFKKALAFCIGGVMALSLAACGDSADKDEQITQETTQESEDENIGLVFNDENADPAGNDMAAIPVSANSNGNGSTAPVFKPGAEPQPGQELKPGEEPESGEAPQSGGAPRPSTAPQSGATSQSGTAPQSGTGSQPTAPQPSAAPQPTHTHTWVTNTVHHDATGHYESIVIGQEQVQVGEKVIESGWRCNYCEWKFITTDLPWGQFGTAEVAAHQKSTGHLSADGYTIKEPVYETRDITENVWVQDSAAWDETITTCSGCGARQ